MTKTTALIKKVYQTTGNNRQLFVDSLVAEAGIAPSTATGYYTVLKALNKPNPKSLLSQIVQLVAADNGETEINQLVDQLVEMYPGTKRKTINQYVSTCKTVCCIDHMRQSTYYATYGDQQTPWQLKEPSSGARKPVTHVIRGVAKATVQVRPRINPSAIRKVYDQHCHLPTRQIIDTLSARFAWAPRTAEAHYYKCANNTYKV